jgi:hypothetical protein
MLATETTKSSSENRSALIKAAGYGEGELIIVEADVFSVQYANIKSGNGSELLVINYTDVFEIPRTGKVEFMTPTKFAELGLNKYLSIYVETYDERGKIIPPKSVYCSINIRRCKAGTDAYIGIAGGVVPFKKDTDSIEGINRILTNDTCFIARLSDHAKLNAKIELLIKIGMTREEIEDYLKAKELKL